MSQPSPGKTPSSDADIVSQSALGNTNSTQSSASKDKKKKPNKNKNPDNQSNSASPPPNPFSPPILQVPNDPQVITTTPPIPANESPSYELVHADEVRHIMSQENSNIIVEPSAPPLILQHVDSHEDIVVVTSVVPSNVTIAATTTAAASATPSGSTLPLKTHPIAPAMPPKPHTVHAVTKQPVEKDPTGKYQALSDDTDDSSIPLQILPSVLCVKGTVLSTGAGDDVTVSTAATGDTGTSLLDHKVACSASGTHKEDALASATLMPKNKDTVPPLSNVHR